MDCIPPGSSAHGILQARILEWVAIPFSRRSFQPRDQSQVSGIVGILYHLTHRESLLIRALIPFLRVQPSWPNYLPKIPYPNINTMGLCSIIQFFLGGRTQIFSQGNTLQLLAWGIWTDYDNIRSRPRRTEAKGQIKQKCLEAKIVWHRFWSKKQAYAKTCPNQDWPTTEYRTQKSRKL